MYRDFGTVLIFALLGIVLVYVPLLIQKLVAPSQKTPDKLANYECGEEPEGSAWVQFNVRFYVCTCFTKPDASVACIKSTF